MASRDVSPYVQLNLVYDVWEMVHGLLTRMISDSLC